MPSRNHCLLRGRPPPNHGESAAGIHSFVGKVVIVTAMVGAQLRAVSNFHLIECRPPAESIFDRLFIVADRLDVLRQALTAFFTSELSADIADDACLERLAPVDALFTSAAAGLRRHTLCNVILSFRRASCYERNINGNICLWVSDLLRFAQQVCPSTVAPQSSVVFDAPSAPTSSRTHAFCASVVDVLQLVEGLHVPRDSPNGISKWSHSLSPSKMSLIRKKSGAL